MSSTTAWRRHTLGAISLTLIVVSGVIWFSPGASDDWAFAQGVCVKIGTVLLMAWVAYPQLERLSPGKTVTVMAVGAIMILRPQLIPVLIPALVRILVVLAPVLFVIWLLRIPSKGRSAR